MDASIWKSVLQSGSWVRRAATVLLVIVAIGVSWTVYSLDHTVDIAVVVGSVIFLVPVLLLQSLQYAVESRILGGPPPRGVKAVQWIRVAAGVMGAACFFRWGILGLVIGVGAAVLFAKFLLWVGARAGIPAVLRHQEQLRKSRDRLHAHFG